MVAYLLSSDLLSSLIANLKLAIDNDLHLVVSVLVDERSSLLQSVEAGRDGRGVIWARLLVGQGGGTAAGDITEVGVLVCDERWLENNVSAVRSLSRTEFGGRKRGASRAELLGDRWVGDVP